MVCQRSGSCLATCKLFSDRLSRRGVGRPRQARAGLWKPDAPGRARALGVPAGPPWLQSGILRDPKDKYLSQGLLKVPQLRPCRTALVPGCRLMPVTGKLSWPVSGAQLQAWRPGAWETGKGRGRSVKEQARRRIWCVFY